MMAQKKVSKTAADKLAFSSSVGAALDVSGADVAEKASKILFEGRRKRLEFGEILRELRAMLRDAEGEYESADAAHADELADDDPLREERDTAKREVLDGMLTARAMLGGAFGAPFAKRVGLTVVLEDRPDLVEKQGAAAVRLLRRAKKPKQSFAGSKVDLASVADELDAKVVKLRGLLASLKKEEREAEKTMIARDQAAVRWSGVTGLAGAILEMLAQIAGEHEIAARVRPTERRRAGILDAVDTGATDADSTDTDPTDTDPTDSDEPTS